MPSTPTARNRLEKQAAGENLNTWGAPKLNTVIDLVDASLDGWTTKALTGNYTLTSTNYSADESRPRILKFTGTGTFTVTIPSVEKWYYVWNATTGVLTITTGAGDTATLAVGEVAPVVCDASNVKKVKVIAYGTDTVSGGSPTASDHFTTKAYVDGLAFAATNLPGQNAGTVNQFIQSNGTTASWVTPSVAHISGAAPLAAPSFTGGVTIAGGLTVAGGLSFTGATGITGDLTVSGALNAGGALNVASLDISSDTVPFAKWKAGGTATAQTEHIIELDGSFEEWEIRFRNITVSATGGLRAEFSFDDGATYKTGSGEYRYQYIGQFGSGTDALAGTATSVTQARLTDSTGAATSTVGGDAQAIITSKAGRETRVRCDYVFDHTTTNQAVMGTFFSSTDFKNYGKATHIKVLHSSGGANTFSYDWSIYGVR